MHNNFIVVFDACVLYPAMLRNVLLQLATAELFRARWTEDIHREWMHSLRRDKPDIEEAKLEALRRAIDASTIDCLVTGYESLTSGITLPDLDDRHIVAASIRCRAKIIVTTNLRHFPANALAPFGLHAQSPDEFILHLIERAPKEVCLAIKSVRSRLRKPPFTAHELLDRVSEHGLTRTAAKLRDHAQLL